MVNYKRSVLFGRWEREEQHYTDYVLPFSELLA